jgi:hypothetical protein
MMIIFYRRKINVRNFFRPTKRLGKITISGRTLRAIYPVFITPLSLFHAQNIPFHPLDSPPTAADKEVTLEIGIECYLGDENQLWLQA